MGEKNVKIIHYCWFGPKPLSKLAKKCMKSWKEFLPDYEIIRWDESNVNLDECPFIREAYNNKAWAFVADYARTRALKEMGGIYFDTDMEVTKNIDGYKDMPIIPKELVPKFKKIKTIEPSKEELDENNRSRSAKLRVIEKIGE